MITITIDWLAVTFKENTNGKSSFMGRYASATPLLSKTARHGYNTCHVDKNGVRAEWHSHRQEMGTHIVFAGSALRNILERGGMEPIEILRDALDMGGSITRLDVAKDAYNAHVDLRQIWRELSDGQRKGTARKISQIEGIDGGHTIYVGSRTSEKFIRMYDKGVQMDRGGEDWKRLELEMKGMVARAAATAIIEDEGMVGAFDAMVKESLDMPTSQEYKKFFPEEGVGTSLSKLQKQTDREKWILTQVIPAVKAHFDENPGSDACWRLWNMLKDSNSNIPF